MAVQGFTDPLRFDPDRFSTERQEDIKFGKNFMAFGSGPHYCVGKEYAINHLTAFLAILSTRHEITFPFPATLVLGCRVAAASSCMAVLWLFSSCIVMAVLLSFLLVWQCSCVG
jgi:hypothetical protein